MKMISQTLGAAYVVVLLWAGSTAAQVMQEPGNRYSSKSIRLVIPYAAGGGTDVVARLIADKVTPGWGQNFVFDNRGGGGGVLGAAIVAKAAPDGYTMLLHTAAYSSMSFIGNFGYQSQTSRYSAYRWSRAPVPHRCHREMPPDHCATG